MHRGIGGTEKHHFNRKYNTKLMEKGIHLFVVYIKTPPENGT